MAAYDPSASLALAFKALGEPNRLRIVALLARRPHYGEELSEVLGLRPATISHHLRVLREVRLVRSRRDSPYVLYSLDFEILSQLGESLLEAHDLDRKFSLPTDEELSARVLSSLLDEDGRLREIPSERRPRTVALRWAARHLETGRLYPERELRLALLRLHAQPDELRHALLLTGWLQRSGLVYRRIEEVELS
jgi:DNA-binding transcriptional ArsR family regulator